jgi:hypothetical protein
LLAPECPQDKFMEGNDVKNRKLSYSKKCEHFTHRVLGSCVKPNVTLTSAYKT